MKQFLKKILFALLLGSVLPSIYIVCVLAMTGGAQSLSYVAAIADKVERLESTDDPKIILVGNSNLAFGIDSETIEEAYGMLVVNMGLHGGIGDVLIEEITKKYINQGDIVVVAHTHYDGNTDEVQDAKLLPPMMASNVGVAVTILQQNFFDLIKALPNYLLESSVQVFRGQATYDATYARSSFNEYGDIAYERTETYTFSEGDARTLAVSENVVSRLNEYNAYCESIGAIMVIAGAPIGGGAYEPSTEEIQAFQNALEEGVECQVISDYMDYLMEEKYFYNTYLHLNDEGAAIRTAQLIEDLRTIILE